MPSPPRAHEAGTTPPERGTFPGSWLDDRDRRYIAWGLGATVLFAAGLVALMFALKSFDVSTADPDAATPVIAPDYPRHLSDFSLADQWGHPVTRADLQGKITVVDFIFTSCSLTCPYVNAQMQKIDEATPGEPVRLLSITLDPADDTVPVLARYSINYGAKPERWAFLTGDADMIHTFVGTSFLPPDTTGSFSYMPGNFAHVQRIVLVDQKGNIVSYFDGLNPHAAESVLAQIKKLEATP